MQQPEYRNDQDLIASLKRGDEIAYNYIFRQHWQPLYAQAYAKLQSREAAEEIVQELFMTLWEKRNELLIDNISHYLRVALRNKCIDHIRKKIVKEKYWTYYRLFLPGISNPVQDTVAFNNLMDAVESGLSTMPEKTQRIFILNRLEGKSVTDIAHSTHLSVKTVEYHITKCMKFLRGHLKDFFILLPVLFPPHRFF
jgi:RNA polymerase sigma-70 factor (family 1)